VRVSQSVNLHGVHPDTVKAIGERPCYECGRRHGHIIDRVMRVAATQNLWVSVLCRRCGHGEMWEEPR
jgi:hypothetical protein